MPAALKTKRVVNKIGKRIQDAHNPNVARSARMTSAMKDQAVKMSIRKTFSKKAK